MVTPTKQLLSPGDIADALHEKVSRVRYVLDRRDIPHVQRVGITRVYHADVVERVRAELEIIACKGQYRTPAPAA